MEIKYRVIWANEDLHYSVGLLDPNDDPALRVTDPTHIIMTDHEKWTPGTDPAALFGITDEEYAWKDSDPDKLDELAQKLRTEIPKDRLIAEQNGVRSKDRVESIDFGKYVRYRRALNEERKKDVIDRLLSTEKLHIMYFNETGRPAVFGYRFVMVFEDRETALDAANEYRKRNYPVLVNTFTVDQYNKENARSVFQELAIRGFGTILFTDAGKKQSLLSVKDILNHPGFVGLKNNTVYGNPALDFAITNVFQLMRTPLHLDGKDPEKAKQTLTAQISFCEGRVVEAMSDARLLVPGKSDSQGNLTTPVLKLKPRDVPESSEDGSAPAAKEENTKSFLPVFTNGMEFFVEDDSFKAVIMTVDEIRELVDQAGLDGFLINVKSRCALPCGPERFRQIDDYRSWKAKADKEAKEREPAEDSPDSDSSSLPLSGLT
ncbi:MAG: SseB family protein [Clostridia bacterium]|nr:SseB family protein [Clostridia bacterium]